MKELHIVSYAIFSHGHIHMFKADIGRNIFASGHVERHQPACPPDTKVRYGGGGESKNRGNVID